MILTLTLHRSIKSCNGLDNMLIKGLLKGIGIPKHLSEFYESHTKRNQDKYISPILQKRFEYKTVYVGGKPRHKVLCA